MDPTSTPLNPSSSIPLGTIEAHSELLSEANDSPAKEKKDEERIHVTQPKANNDPPHPHNSERFCCTGCCCLVCCLLFSCWPCILIHECTKKEGDGPLFSFTI